MRCLITGINGFAASHLAERLLNSGHEVHGTVRIRAKKDNLDLIIPSVPLHTCDLSDPYGIGEIIKKTQPDVVFHLAAQSFVAFSWDHPVETLETNVMGTLHLLEAIRRYCPSARVHIASSSQVYGKIDEQDQPMTENSLFNPMNPYDTSKLAQEMLALQYHNSYGLKIIRTRAFNITGPKRGESFAESSWAKQIAWIEKMGHGTILHGNLESFRDYVDVRDVVIAYEWAGIEGEPGGLYLLGSGFPTQMRSILNTLLNLKLPGTSIDLAQDKARMRPSDTPFMQCGSDDLCKIVGKVESRPLIPLTKSLRDLLEYWRLRT